jgi:uncharacterized protein YjbI with pentapeptide repeats
LREQDFQQEYKELIMYFEQAERFIGEALANSKNSLILDLPIKQLDSDNKQIKKLLTDLNETLRSFLQNKENTILNSYKPTTEYIRLKAIGIILYTVLNFILGAIIGLISGALLGTTYFPVVGTLLGAFLLGIPMTLEVTTEALKQAKTWTGLENQSLIDALLFDERTDTLFVSEIRQAIKKTEQKSRAINHSSMYLLTKDDPLPADEVLYNHIKGLKALELQDFIQTYLHPTTSWYQELKVRVAQINCTDEAYLCFALTTHEVNTLDKIKLRNLRSKPEFKAIANTILPAFDEPKLHYLDKEKQIIYPINRAGVTFDLTSYSRLENINLDGSILCSSKLDPILYTKITDASLRKATIVVDNLSLFNVDLEGATLEKAPNTIINANLNNTRLIGIDLSCCSLEKVSFEGAKFFNDEDLSSPISFGKALTRLKPSENTPAWQTEILNKAILVDVVKMIKQQDTQSQKPLYTVAYNHFKENNFFSFFNSESSTQLALKAVFSVNNTQQELLPLTGLVDYPSIPISRNY